MKMAEFYGGLNLVFLFWFVGNVCRSEDGYKGYNLCDNLKIEPQLKETGYIRVHPSRKLPESQEQCKIIFSLCRSCRLWIQFEKSNLKANPWCPTHLSSHCIEDCDYLRVVDEIYNTTHAFLFTPTDAFTSVSNEVTVTLCHKSQRDIRFELKFRVDNKIIRINPQLTPTFKSPGFPGGYALNGEEFLYEIIKPPDVQDMLVTFTDWIMSDQSKLVVYNGGPVKTYYGNASRPLFASSKSIQLNFKTGFRRLDVFNTFYSPYRFIVRGFKANISFRGPSHTKTAPSSRCGHQSGILTDYGGLIKFSPLVDGTYDCVWVIMIHGDYKSAAVILETFRTRYVPTIKFYEGLTSEGRLIRTIIRGQRFSSQNPNGFYIRLQGLMEVGDVFELAYSSFISAGGNCPFDFRCKNGFCIRLQLKCDGVRHCLDGSDETECFRNDLRSNTPTDTITSSNWSVSIIIPVVITIFIFIILCLFFIFVRRFRKISRGGSVHPPHRRQARVASIGGSLSQQYHQNHFSMNLTLEGELDSPPSYEEVMNTPPPRGNWNLAFNWSQQDLRDTPAPPPYSEYMREEINVYNGGIAVDNDMSDLSTIPTDSSSSNNCTDPTSEDQNSTSTSSSDTVYSENIYDTICETPANSLDRWMVDRSTSTSEEGINLDLENNNNNNNYYKIATADPVVRERSTETQTDQNNLNFPLSGAVSNKSSSALGNLDPNPKDDPKNKTLRYRNLSVDGQISRPTRSRSMDSESNYPSDNPYSVQYNTVQNRGNKNGSSGRRNSYPSVIFLTDQQLNNEVFV